MNLDPNSQDNFYTQFVKNKLREEEEQRLKKLAKSIRRATGSDAALPGWRQRPYFGSLANKEAAKLKQQDLPRRINPSKFVRRFPSGIAGSNEQSVLPKIPGEKTVLWKPKNSGLSKSQAVQLAVKVGEPVKMNPTPEREDQAVPQTANTLPVAPPARFQKIEPDDEEIFIAQEPEIMDGADFEDVGRGNGGGGGNNRGAGANGGEEDNRSHLKLTDEDIAELMRFKADYETRQKWKVFSIGVFLTAITLVGALLGYVRAYNRFFRRKGVEPTFYPMRPITRYAMKRGAMLIWGVVIAVGLIVLLLMASSSYTIGWILGFLIAYLTSNFMASLVVYGVFKAWRSGVKQTLRQGEKFGSARFANPDELEPFQKPEGFYIGDGLHFKDKGHLLTVAGTRGGKGRDIIIPNLLGAANIECSWVVIDPKAENLVITSDWQRESGQNVVILNPWHLLSEHVGEAQSYNPLDMLSDKSSPNLVDDVAMISEMIVPLTQGDKNAFFSDGARMVIAGLLLHLVTSEPKETRTLKTLWEWTRKIGDDWNELIQAMVVNSDPVNGDTVSNAANEITKLSDSGSETFGSIISNVLQATDFLKSTAMQQSLQSGFDPQILAEGRTTVYVVIPADKLRSHARWLRLVVTSMMRAVIRKPKKRVCFLLDEFAALGYLPEIETALSTYSGYKVTVWPILQSLIQLKNLYRDNWESFIANSAVRQYFSIKDNFSADYISHAAGLTSNVLVSRSWFGVNSAESNQRPLLTPDEIRIRSGKEIFLFINELPVTVVQKVAYFIMEEIKDRARKNPYIS